MPRAKIRNPQPSTRYRAGARDAKARAVHTQQSREWRRALANALFDAVDRHLFVHALITTGDMAAAADRLGVSVAQVYGRMRWDTQFSEQVETVLADLCADVPHCGSVQGYRQGGRCAACRAAKALDRSGAHTEPSGNRSRSTARGRISS